MTWNSSKLTAQTIHATGSPEEKLRSFRLEGSGYEAGTILFFVKTGEPLRPDMSQEGITPLNMDTQESQIRFDIAIPCPPGKYQTVLVLPDGENGRLGVGPSVNVFEDLFEVGKNGELVA